jgi:hypothetical protein
MIISSSSSRDVAAKLERDQGNFHPDQGIPFSSAIWHLPCRQIDPPRQISDVAEKANRDAARYEVAEADLELDADFVNLKGRHPIAATHRGR